MLSLLQRRDRGLDGGPGAFRSQLADESFAHRLQARQAEHDGCVNTVAFTGAGDILVSGGDDRHIALLSFWEIGE